MSKKNTILHDLTFNTPEEHASTHNWLTWEYKQVSAGTYEVRMRYIDFDNFSVVVESQNKTIQKLGAMSGLR